MKTIQSLILGTLIAGSLTHLSAESSVDQQIAAIQKASAQERVELMNQFKLNLANMNEADRIKTMNQLRERLQLRSQNKSGDSLENPKEMQQMREMNQMQHMNQMQQTNQMQYQNMGQVQNATMNGSMQGGKR